MKTFSENIKSLNDNQKMFIESINDMNEQLLTLQSIGSTVAQHSDQIKSLESENKMLKTSVKTFSVRLDNLEQKDNQCKLQISGVPSIDNENLKAVVINIANKLEVTLFTDDVIDSYRTRNRNRKVFVNLDVDVHILQNNEMKDSWW